MKYIPLCAVVLGVLTLPRDAAAVPIEYHVTFELSPNAGSGDFLGVSSATFDLWTTVDAALPPGPGDSDGSSGRLGFWYGLSDTRLRISGSSGYEGLYDASGWTVGIGDDTDLGDYVVLHELAATVGGHRLSFGPIFALFDPLFANDEAAAPLAPFEFGSSNVSEWRFRWADAPSANSRYTPTVLSGSARQVPEPGSLMLLSVGAIGLMIRRRSKRVR